MQIPEKPYLRLLVSMQFGSDKHSNNIRTSDALSEITHVVIICLIICYSNLIYYCVTHSNVAVLSIVP